MISIATLKIDGRRRITFPKNFIIANNIDIKVPVKVFVVSNKKDSVRIQFKIKDK